MAVELNKLKALTIRQPWADMIARGLKTIEVREWLVKHRGPFLIHVGRTVDWKAVQVLGYENVEELPRGCVIGYAEIQDVFPFDRGRWLSHLREHWVVHPMPEPSFGVALRNIRVFDKPVRCRGNRYFFSLPPSTLNLIAKRLRDSGLEVLATVDSESSEGDETSPLS